MTYEYNYIIFYHKDIVLLFISKKTFTCVSKWWGHQRLLVCAIFSVIKSYFDWHPSNISLNCNKEWNCKQTYLFGHARGWSTDAVWKHSAASLSTETWRHNPFLNGSQCSCMESGQHHTSMGTWNLWTTLQNISSAITSLVQIISELVEGGVKGEFSPPKPETCLTESSNIVWSCITTLSALSDHLFFEFRISRLTLQISYCGKTLRAPHFYIHPLPKA